MRIGILPFRFGGSDSKDHEIAPGHLVIAQEALDYGWREAIVLGRNGDMFTLRFRDYPKLPKFVRHRNAIALMNPPAD